MKYKIVSLNIEDLTLLNYQDLVIKLVDKLGSFEKAMAVMWDKVSR